MKVKLDIDAKELFDLAWDIGLRVQADTLAAGEGPNNRAIMHTIAFGAHYFRVLRALDPVAQSAVMDITAGLGETLDEAIRKEAEAQGRPKPAVRYYIGKDKKS